jgi:hypothetical protein
VVGGGLSVPTGAFKDLHDLGYHADVALLVNLGGIPVRIRPEVTLSRFGLKDSLQQTAGGTYGPGGYSQMLGAFGQVEIPLVAGFYLLAGAGALNVRTDPGSGAAGTTVTEFAIDGGAGWRLRLGSIEAFIEGRLNNVYTDRGALNLREVRVVPVTFGLVF